MPFYRSLISRQLKKTKPRKFKCEDNPKASDRFAEAWASVERKYTKNSFLEPISSASPAFINVIKARQIVDHVVGKDANYRAVCGYLFTHWPSGIPSLHNVYTSRTAEKVLFAYCDEIKHKQKVLVTKKDLYPVLEKRFRRMQETRRLSFEEALKIASLEPAIFPPDFIEHMKGKRASK